MLTVSILLRINRFWILIHPRVLAAALFSLVGGPLVPIHAGELSLRPTQQQSSTLSKEGQKEEIKKLLSVVKLEPYPESKKNAECVSFLEDFKNQKEIEYLQPSIRAATLDEPLFQNLTAKCPTLNFTANVYFRSGSSHQIIPKQVSAEICRNFSCEEIVSGTKDFQIYEVDFDSNSDNGKETIYYESGLTGRKKYVGGLYKLLDLNNCKITAYKQVPGSRPLTMPMFSNHGFIRYKGKVYLFDLESQQFPNQKSPLANLRLHKFYSEKKPDSSELVLFRDICLYGP